jgi:hypothetical protein
MRGRWAQGLEPRNFVWIIKDRLAVSERPGGYARNHRKVRREEELIWLERHGFTRIVSLLDSPHNLAAYGEAGIPAVQVSLGRPDEASERLPEVYATLAALLDEPGARVLVHHEDVGDRMLGVIAGYLLYSGAVDQGPHAILIVERLAGRELHSEGREIVAVTIDEGLRAGAGGRSL